MASDTTTDATDGGGDADVGGPPPCTVATECPGQDSECQHRTCTAGVCGTANEVTGKVLATQVIGDCHVRQCGANGVVAIVVDDKDIPDDINPCTTDACATGVPSHTAVAKDTTCGGGKLCNATGQCVGCNVASDCPGTDNFCRTRTCTQNVCGVTNKAAGTKLVDSQSGDCKIQQCDGQGVIQTVADGTDLPVDNNPCTQDQCNGETPTHQPVARNTSCGGAQVCDGASKCVTCLIATTCPGTDTECQSRTCTSGSCGTSFAAAGKAVAAQTAGDCSKKQCDGHGVVVGVSDTTDPFVDNNPCTSDLCVNGSPSNPNLPAHTNCGPNLQCDGNGLCVTCLTVADCPGTDTECKARTCVAGRCGTSFTAAGTPLSAPNQTVGDCKQNQCDGQGAITAAIDNTDTQNDNNACTNDICTAGVSSHPNTAATTACGTTQGGATLECDGSGHCVGCLQASDCGANTECVTHTCTNNMCGTTNTAAGTAVSIQMAKDCKKNQCDGSGLAVSVPDNTDLPVDGLDCTMDLCTNGVPSNPPIASGLCSQGGGMKCNSSNICVQCLTKVDCGTDDECKKFTCSVQGACSVANTPANTAISAQTAHDCQMVVCNGSGTTTSIADDTDKPMDGNACTDDVCTAGVPSNPVVIDRSCNVNQFCKSDGSCVQCNTDVECGNAMDTFCLKHTCVNNVCTIASSTAAGTLLPMADQTVGDCKDAICDGSGGVISQANTGDKHDDGNACTVDKCNGSTPDNSQAVTVGTPCGMNNSGMCNGTACVGCLMNSDCGTDTECQHYVCNSANNGGTCETHPVADGTVLVSGQMAGDCKQVVCDGNGLTRSSIDITDIPTDSNDCTVGACAADGTPSNPIVVDHACGTNGFCKGDGTCVGCNTDAECVTVSQPNTECRINTCNNNACSIANTSAGTACNESGGRRCDGSGLCVPAVAVLRLGDGTATLASSGTPAFVEIRSETTSVIYQTITLPTATAGNVNAFALSGTATSEGALSLSGDGHSVTVAGYLIPTPVAMGALSASSTASQRLAAKIDSSGNVDTSAALPNGASSFFVANNVRTVVTGTGTDYWFGGPGNSGGVVYFVPPASSMNPAQILPSPSGIRVCQIVSGQLYCTSSTSAFSNVFTVGTGLPTSGTQTATVLTGLPATGSTPQPYSFVLMDLDPNDGVTPDTLYLTDDRTPAGTTAAAAACAGGGIQKWTRASSSSSWSCIGTIQTGVPGASFAFSGTRGIAAEGTANSLTIVATTASAPNAIISCTDQRATVPGATGSCTLISASGNAIYRGVALAPLP
ncbi:MAG TPA: hypothetical protein VGL59_00110 [Polyangia bacterium]